MFNQQNPNQIDSTERFDKADIESFENQEAQEFFMSKQEADEKESKIHEAIKILSNNSDVFEPRDSFTNDQNFIMANITG